MDDWASNICQALPTRLRPPDIAVPSSLLHASAILV